MKNTHYIASFVLFVSLMVTGVRVSLSVPFTLNGSMSLGGSQYATDIFGGLLAAPCRTAARQSAGTGIIRSPLDMNNAATGWEGYWHELKVSGRWFVCDPMDNAFFTNSFEVPGMNQYGANYPALLAKYGGTTSNPTPAVIAYMNARAKRMQSFGFNTVGNNLNTDDVEHLYYPFPNSGADVPAANPPMPFFFWPHSTDISTRRINFASSGSDNWGYHTIKKMPAMYPTLIWGQPQPFPGAPAGLVPNVDWMDIFDPQWVCAQAVYDTDNHGTLPAYCPQTNNAGTDWTVADWIGGGIAGTTETLMNGSSGGPFAPGTYNVTIANSAGLSQCASAASPCTMMIDPGLADGEDAEISDISGSTFKVTTAQTHPQGFTVRSGTDWIFAVTGEDSDYWGGMVDQATLAEGNNKFVYPGLGALVSSPTTTTLDFQADFPAYGSTTFTSNVTHSTTSQTVSVANANALPASGIYLDASKGTTSEEVVTSYSIVDSTHIKALFHLDHASGDVITTVAGTGENGPPIAYFGNSGISANFTTLSAAVAAGAECLAVTQTAPLSTISLDNTVTLDPGFHGYDSVTYEDGPYTVDGIGTSGPSGCNAANDVHITTALAHAHASGAKLETPLGIDTVNHTKAELQAWLEGSGISGSYGSGAGSFDDLTSGAGYGTGDAGICKLDEAWGLIEPSYNCATLTGWPLTYNGTLTQAVTGSSTAQTVNVSSTSPLAVGRYLDVDPATASREMVRITAIGTGTVTGVFLQSHASGAAIQAGGYAGWGSASGWNEDSTRDPGRDFLDENGFHTWVSAVTGDPGAYNAYYANALGNTTSTNAIAPGAGVTIDVADIRGIREGTQVYLDGHDLVNRQAVTASNVTADTYPAGHFTANVKGTMTYPSGTLVTSQMFNDLDSLIMHYMDYYVSTLKSTVDAALPGVPTNPLDHMEGSRYAVWAGAGRNAVMFESAVGGPGNLCRVGQLADDQYTQSGDDVPIIEYFRPDAQNDSEFRDLSTASNDAVAAAGVETVHLACAESGAYPCNMPASATKAYNVTIDPGSANKEVAACTFTQASGAGNSTMTCPFAYTHAANFPVWAAVAYPTNPNAMEDWSTPTQDAKGQFYYDFWLTGKTERYCTTDCSSWVAPATQPPFCPNFGPAPAAYPKYFGNLSQTSAGAWNFQADDGDYPFVGTAVWQMYGPNPSPTVYSDHEDYGFFDYNENAYDGKEPVQTTNCTNWEGFSCGGELMNYGDALDRVAQANHKIWTNMIGWLQANP